ncbi:flippase [bacterium]|nr:flippase [bacterium]
MSGRNIIVVKNASILLITDIVSKVLRVVLSIVIALKLGASDLGLLAYGVAFSELFSFIPSFGLNNFVNREVAKNPDQSGSYFGNLIFAKIIFSFGAFLILFIVYIMKIDPEKFSIVCIAFIIMIFDSFIVFYTGFFRGFQKSEYEALILISENFLVASSGILVIGLGYNLLTMMIVRLIVTFIIFCIGFLIVKRKFILHTFSLHLPTCIKMLRLSLPFAFLMIINVINAQIGIVLLTQIKGTLFTGWYIAALKLCAIFQFIPSSVAGAIMPAMTKYVKEKNHTGVNKTLQRSIKYLLMLILPISVGTTLLADKIILLFYDETFIQSIFTLRIIIWVIVLSFTNTIFNAAFCSINKEKKFLRFQTFALIMNIILCLLLIPVIAHNGVAIATIASQLCTFILADIGISRYFKDLRIMSFVYKMIFATVIMALFISFISSLNIFIIVFISMFVYFILLFLFRSFDSDELAILKLGVIKFFPIIRN